MTPIEKDKLEILCKKWNLSELKISKGIFIADDNSGITMNLRGDVPVLGVTIAGTVQTEGHGLLKIVDIQTEINQIMKSSSKKLQSSVPDQDATPKGNAKGSNPASGGTNKAPEPKKDDVMKGAIPSESKLGAGDTPPGKKGTTTAICQACKCTITGTIDTFRQIQDEYGVIYCQKCSEDADRKLEVLCKKWNLSDCSDDADRKVEVKEEPPKASTKIPMCRKCGLEVSHSRALACLGNDEPCMCEDCGEKHDKKEHQETEKGKDARTCPTCNKCGYVLSDARALEIIQKKITNICEKCEDKQKVKPEQKENIMSGNLPAKNQEANLPTKKTDAQIDEMIEFAKAEKFLKGQGGSYTVSGKNRPDSAMVQKIANAENISCEILFAEQTKDYAHVVVRGHQGNNYIDAVVHHDFETEFQLQTMEIIKKNPQILDHYDGLIPVIQEGAIIVLSDKQIDAKYHLIHTLLSFKTFSLRDATTKAMQIVQSKLLNQDPRTKEEVASEQKERDLVEEKRNQKR